MRSSFPTKGPYYDSEGKPFLIFCDVYYRQLRREFYTMRVLNVSIPGNGVFFPALKKGTIVSGPPRFVGKNISELKNLKLKKL